MNYFLYLVMAVLKLTFIVLKYIYISWVALVFILFMLVAFVLLMPGHLLPGRAANRYSNFILRWWAMIWSALAIMPIRSEGRDRSIQDQTMVIVTNHNSYLDAIASYTTVRHLFKTLAKKELTQMPLMGQIFLTSGIMVDRSSTESRKASYQRMVAAIKSGTSIVIYPEGTQNRTDNVMKSFYNGAFRLAIECQVPVLPIVTMNTRKILPQAQFTKIRPGTIWQIYLSPVPTKGMTMEDVEGLKDQVYARMEAVICQSEIPD